MNLVEVGRRKQTVRVVIGVVERRRIPIGCCRKGVAPTHVYVPEAAAPLLWVGRVRGAAELDADRPAVDVPLAVCVSRPGAYSLARGLQIDAADAADAAADAVSGAVRSAKLEFTLIVESAAAAASSSSSSSSSPPSMLGNTFV